MSDEMLSQEEIEALLRGETLEDKNVPTTDQNEEELNIEDYLSPIEQYDRNAEQIQMRVLRNLVGQASDTKWGRDHNFSQIKNYEDFTANVPVNTYEELKGYIQQMRYIIYNI